MRDVSKEEVVREGVSEGGLEQGVRRQGLQDGDLTLKSGLRRKLPRKPKASDRGAFWGLIAAIILVALVLFFIVLSWVSPARAEELSQIDVKLAAYCVLYSREMTFIEVMHPTRSITADTDVILGVAQKHYGECLSILPTLLPLPAELGSTKEWLADIRDLLIERAGRKPASDPPEPEKVASGTDEWRAQCAAEYRTWDPDTGTVVRNGSPDRVPCPCGKEVTCVNPQEN